MEIRINGKKIKAQILPMNKPTLDETLESFSFALVSNDNPMPFAPCQSVQVITDSNEKINLFLVSDSVEVYSVSPTKWKHNIMCVQNTRKLSKHLVRNSSFTTPYDVEKKSFTAYSISKYTYKDTEPFYFYYDISGLQKNGNFIQEPLTLRTINNYAREKIKNAYFKFTAVGIYGNASPQTQEISGTYVNSIENVDDIIERTESTVLNTVTVNNELFLCYTDNLGNPHRERINPSEFSNDSWYPLNKKIRYNKIIDLYNEGCNNFYISFDYDTALISGSFGMDTYESNTYAFIAFQAEIIAEIYYYNCYQILDLLRIRQQKTRHENGNWVSDPALFVLDPNRDLEKMLIATPAPNFTFTQMTMYECVAEVFRLFDAIFTMDENGYLGIEYFNERNGRNITNSLKKVGQNSTSSEDKYTNGLVAYYQNAKPVEEFPNSTFAPNGTWGSIKTKELGVPADNNSFIFETPHTISEILDLILSYKDFQFVLNLNNGVNQSVNITASNQLILLNITHYVVEEKMWTLLDNSLDEDANPSLLKQINTIFYKKGTKEIDVSYNYKRYGLDTKFAITNLIKSCLYRIFGVLEIADSGEHILITGSSGDYGWTQLGYRVSYITDVDGRVKVESFQRKYDGETLIDQYNGAVDLNKMGLNILGLSLKLGNPTLTVTQKITSWNNRIKQGDIYNYEGKTWIANVVAYTFLGDGKIQATIQFVQNFNNLAMRTQLLREKRLSLISNELTVKSEENLVDYVYFSTEYANIQANAIGYKDYMIRTNLYASLGGGASTLVPAEMAVIETSGIAYKVYIPMIKYGSGNMICHEISFEDPISAGKQTTTHTEGWFTAHTAYFTNILKYTNDYGEFELVNIHILPSSEVGMVPELYPYVDAITAYQNVEILNLAYHKQPNEIFALNYQLCFLPWDANKDFIGSRFINYNAFVNDTTRKWSDLVLYYRNDDFQYSVLDIKGDGSTLDIAAVTVSTARDHVYLYNFSLSQRITATSWAICERDGAILFASNRKLTNASTVQLCFATNSQRVDKKILDEF